MTTRIRTKARGHQENGGLEKPTWEVALLFPNQGQWSEEDYLELDTNHLVELSSGHLEVLAMPTTTHQWITLLLYELLKAFAYPKLGLVLAAPLPVQLWPGKMREPDVVFMLKEHRRRVHERYWERADLVMEVVSGNPESRRRDLVKKRAEYARADIGEYWIIDSKLRQITVLGLGRSRKYQILGVYKKDGKAVSRLLTGFAVDVASVFAKP